MLPNFLVGTEETLSLLSEAAPQLEASPELRQKATKQLDLVGVVPYPESGAPVEGGVRQGAVVVIELQPPLLRKVTR